MVNLTIIKKGPNMFYNLINAKVAADKLKNKEEEDIKKINKEKITKTVNDMKKKRALKKITFCKLLGGGNYCEAKNNINKQQVCYYFELATNYKGCVYCRQDLGSCDNHKCQYQAILDERKKELG